MPHRIKQKQILRDQDNLLVPDEDLTSFDDAETLPYLKCIELVKHTPQHFGLEKWTPFFRLSDSWMRKIYQNEAYSDTDLPPPEPEKFTNVQRKVLNDWLRRHKLEQGQTSVYDGLRKEPPPDCLVECLNKLEEDTYDDSNNPKSSNQRISQSSPLGELSSDNIAICTKHRVQTEDVIVKLALQKVKDLDPKEEKRYQELLKDKEFMELLNRHVEQYLKE